MSLIRGGNFSAIYAHKIKMIREITGEINCSRCPYHKGENGRSKSNSKPKGEKPWKQR